jgi:hypothetical protein
LRSVALWLLLWPLAAWGQGSADELFERGMDLARQGRFAEAREAFAAGRRAAPAETRFLVEGAGAAYRLEKLGEARRLLRGALRREPDDEYARNFLGTLYLLDGNVEAALAVWGPLGKPKLTAVETPQGLKIDPVLLDRAVAFAPGEVVELPEWRMTERRLDLLDVFSGAGLDLSAQDDGFVARLRAAERNGFGPTRWAAALQAARALPFQAVRLDYFNIGGRAANVRSLARWDANKRRGWLEYEQPIRGEPALRGRLFLDARDERWDVRSAPGDEKFQMRTGAIGGGFSAVAGGRLTWGGEAAWTYRDFDRSDGDLRRLNGAGARADVFANWAAWRAPARRMSVDAATRVRLGRVWDQDGGRYARFDQRLRFDWIPVRKGDVWRAQAEAAAGAIAGRAPFDELYILGVERDNDLWLRGIPGTYDGRKGAAPLGDRFWLTNLGFDRRLFRLGFLELRAGPFFDAGRVTDTRGRLGAPRTLFAAGAALRLRLLGAVEATFLVGRDLTSGATHWYAYSEPSR